MEGTRLLSFHRRYVVLCGFWGATMDVVPRQLATSFLGHVQGRGYRGQFDAWRGLLFGGP